MVGGLFLFKEFLTIEYRMVLTTEVSLAREKLEQMRKELSSLEEYCNREEETLRLNANLDGHTGYKYYMRENEKLSDNSNKKRNEIEAQIRAYTTKREAEIEALQTQIRIYTEKKEAEIEAIDSKARTTTEFYRTSMNDIEKNLCTPKSIIYKRKMTDVKKLREEIPPLAAMVAQGEKEEDRIRKLNTLYLQKEAIKLIQKADEDQKAIDLKHSLAIKAINDQAEEKSKQRRIRNGLEKDGDDIYHTHESYDEKFAKQ